MALLSIWETNPIRGSLFGKTLLELLGKNPDPWGLELVKGASYSARRLLKKICIGVWFMKSCVTLFPNLWSPGIVYQCNCFPKVSMHLCSSSSWNPSENVRCRSMQRCQRSTCRQFQLLFSSVTCIMVWRCRTRRAKLWEVLLFKHHF